MAEAAPGQPAQRSVPLPPGIDLLWGRRERGKRGPRPGLSADAIVEAAIRLADAEGLEAVSMARLAAELGFTTMSLYRYVTNKDELLQLMWNASTLGPADMPPDSLAPGGTGSLLGEGSWRDRMRRWAVVQREVLDRHPWITQMPMATPPVGPNSMLFVEHGFAAMDGTGLTDLDKLSVIGLLSSYTLSEARMAADAMRAGQAAQAAMAGAETGAGAEPAGTEAETDGLPDAPEPPPGFDALLRELVDEPTYPRLYHLAWSPDPGTQRSEREEFLFGVDLILDGIQALIDRSGGGQ
jgi:AcrR family transcriptional regulator